MTKRFFAVDVLAPAVLAAAMCNPGPVNPPNPGPTGGAPPVVQDAGQGGADGGLPTDTLVVSACTNATLQCGANFQECVRQSTRLRGAAGYATLSNTDLECVARAPNALEIRACEVGLCK